MAVFAVIVELDIHSYITYTILHIDCADSLLKYRSYAKITLFIDYLAKYLRPTYNKHQFFHNTSLINHIFDFKHVNNVTISDL